MAARLFVINESEAEAAAELFTSSQKPEIVVSGNPAWEKFAFPELTRERVRELLGIGSSELVIMSPGIKDLVLNILLWGTIIEAASGTDVLGMLRHDVRVICSLHPGDPNDPQLYQSLTNGDREGLQIEIIPASKMKGSEMLPGIDLVIESFSTIGIEAAHQRIPVIACLTRLARHRYYQQSQRHDWPPYEMGAARVFKNDGSTDLASIISNMLWSSADLRSDMVQNLQDRQAKAYPQPAALGSAVSIMADSIERIKR
jgi:hypothetical protein